LSFHDFQSLPKNITEIFEKMQQFSPAIYKFAVTPKSRENLADFYKFTQQDFFTKNPAIFTTMGKFGIEGREFLKNKTWGGFYAINQDFKTASGQLCLDDLEV